MSQELKDMNESRTLNINESRTLDEAPENVHSVILIGACITASR